MSTDKLDLSSPDLVNQNIEKIAALFPNCVTETAEGKAIDFDLLKQELNQEVVEGAKERYRLEWPGKKEAIVTANLPTTKTLRPVREDSVNFDTTENMYIEGDNLEVLKILQESYLGKIKIVYIDPPYNRGDDLVYKDNFTQDSSDYKEETDQTDEYGNRLVANPETAGRYHSDWLSMMYPRLKLARNLLTDDGVFFVSIGEHEIHNLRKICDNVFGESNFITTLIWDTNHSAQAGLFKVYHQYVLVYGKNESNLNVPRSLNNDLFEAGAMKKESARHPKQKFTFPKGTRFNAEEGFELKNEWGDAEKVILHKGKMICRDGKLAEDVVLEASWTQANQMKEYFYGNKESVFDSRGQRIEEFYFSSTGKLKIIKERSVSTPQTTLKYQTQGIISKKLADLFSLQETPFDSPKSPEMIGDFIKWFCDEDSIILDFFSGSATTAHSVMSINSQDSKFKLKYILIQLPENTDKNTVAYKAGYLTIPQIGKERIRRAATKIKEETNADIDYGFKVFKVASSNMQDVYYKPQDYTQGQLDVFADNIKEDRTSEDLLTQILLDWGLPLTLKTEPLSIQGKEVFKVDTNYLMACFANNVDEAFAKEIATYQPLRVVFKDSGFKDDTAKENVKQLLKQLSPNTEMKVI